ncbi:hypothetical protein PVAP13_5NG062343 [Panicum virgatum]|uniref:Uncharacterized protein n=1 Tax=Panicum virgatum TaxID=38727 RepID=A0A8T0RN58_PANVG|nr:hypothetical protein PVAP13_5NG062343 [Panicum virgatum]
MGCSIALFLSSPRSLSFQRALAVYPKLSLLAALAGQHGSHWRPASAAPTRRPRETGWTPARRPREAGSAPAPQAAGGRRRARPAQRPSRGRAAAAGGRLSPRAASHGAQRRTRPAGTGGRRSARVAAPGGRGGTWRRAQRPHGARACADEPLQSKGPRESGHTGRRSGSRLLDRPAAGSSLSS